MTRAQKIAANKADKRIESLYYRHCSGVEIDIMDIGRVFKAGHAAIAENPAIDDSALGAAIVAFVATIRKK